LLTKTQIADEIHANTGIGKNLIKRVLDDLAELAEDELSDGNDFTVPGVCRLKWRYTKAFKKGEKRKKGEVYVGFGGEEKTAETDSPATPAKVALRASVTGRAARAKPTRAEASAFLRSKAGKAIAARLSK